MKDFDAEHLNYQSMEDSPHGYEVLKDLVDRGYDKEFSSRAGARKFLKGCEPILSKLALIFCDERRQLVAPLGA